MKKLIINLTLVIFVILLHLQNANALTTTKTVGTGGDFITLKAAFDAINAGTVTGDITLQIIGSTTETTYAMLNASGTGSASYTSIVIYPTGSGYSITGNLGSTLYELNGAKNVTLDGRVNQTGSTPDLVISNTGTATSSSRTVLFENGASNNTIKYCYIKGANQGATASIICFTSTTGSTGNSNNTIDHCNITNSGTRPGNAIYSQGTAGKENSGNIISNNNFYDFFTSISNSNGIYINSATTNWTITGNSFYETTSFVPAGAYAYNMIYVNNTSGNNFTITGNYLGGKAPLCSDTMKMNNPAQAFSFTAINMSVGTTTASSVQNNLISGISLKAGNGATSLPGLFTGISINGGSVNVGTVTGNIIGSNNGAGILIYNTISGAYTAGIYSNSTGNVNIQNNNIGSISAGGDATIGYTFYGINTSGATGNYNISGNSIGNNTANSIAIGINGVTSAVTNIYGIINTAKGTISITSNNIQNCSSFGSGLSTFTGILNTGTTSTLNMNGNILANNTLAGTGSYAAISNIVAVTGTININNNNISSAYLTAANTPGSVAIINNSNAGAASTLTISSNTISGIHYTAGGTGTFAAIGSTGAPLNSTINLNNFVTVRLVLNFQMLITTDG